MTSTRPHVEPLDPDSPAGQACAAELTSVLATIETAVLGRQRTAIPKRRSRRQDEAA
jgi:hypothetical protein